MRVGGGWILDWEIVIEWAIRGDPVLYEEYHKYSIDTADRRSLCAAKFLVWFEDQNFSRKVGAMVTSTNVESVIFLAVYSGIDKNGTLTKFKKFHPQPQDEELKVEIATMMNISAENFVWASIADPCKQDHYL